MKVAPVSSPLLILCSVLAPTITAWGGLGHETVAFVASSFVNHKTQLYFHSVLGDKSTQYLANVSTWADSYRLTSAGRFSAPFHFIDSLDNPPTTCGVNFSRDCGTGGCVVAAIQNYTTRLMNTELLHAERLIAAKFIIHFIGDIHQPLHDESIDRGGNNINVTFSGQATNLHAIWDTNIPEKLVGGYSLAYAQKWAASLIKDITSGIYQSEAAGWLDGIDLDDPVSSALVWAEEANAFVCSTVMPDGIEGVEGLELSGDYYEAAVPVVELQIARAGYRLAAWLNLIASGSVSVEDL